MDSMKGLFGGDDDKEVLPGETKGHAKDFVNRYMTGSPSEGYSREEAVDQFKRVAKHATPDQLQRATQQAVDNLPADQRAEFNQMLQQRQAGQGTVDIQRTGGGGGQAAPADDPLGGLLGGLLGGGAAGGTGGLDDMLGGLLGGGGESDKPGATQSQGGGGDMFGGLGDIMSSPVGKAVIGGIAAFAMKEVLDRN